MLGRLWQHDHHGKLPVGGQAVGFIGSHLAFARNDPLAGDDAAQGSNDAVAAAEHLGIGFGHTHRHPCNSVMSKQRYQPFDGLHIGLAKTNGNRVAARAFSLRAAANVKKGAGEMKSVFAAAMLVTAMI